MVLTEILQKPQGITTLKISNVCVFLGYEVVQNKGKIYEPPCSATKMVKPLKCLAIKKVFFMLMVFILNKSYGYG